MWDSDKPIVYDSSIPLYYQVQKLLLHDMATRVEIDGKLPSEIELCKRYGVSRTPMRQALDRLVKDGYIERYKGRGTFLRKKPPRASSDPGAPRTPTICLAVPSDHPGGVIAMAVSILDYRALAEGYVLTVTSLTREIDAMKHRLSGHLDGEGISGVVYVPLIESQPSAGLNDQLLELYKQHDIPFVIIDRLPVAIPESTDRHDESLISLFATLDYDFVLSDNLSGGFTATEHLIKLGHTRLAFFGTALSHPSYLREAGFRNALRKYGLADEDCAVFRRPDLSEGGGDTTQTVREMASRGITAVFAEHDYLARRVMRSAADIGLRIPADLSLIGFDDLEMCEYLDPPLSSIRQPVEQEIRTAVEILFQKIQKRSEIVRHVILPVELVTRGSTARIRD